MNQTEIENLANETFCYLEKQEQYRKIQVDQVISENIPEISLISAKKDIEERLRVKLKTGRVSNFLIQQLAIHGGGYGEKFGDKIEFYQSAEICNVIELIENDTLIGEPFTRVLHGNFKVHHGTYSSLGYSIIRNIKEYWFHKNKIRPERKIEFSDLATQFGNVNRSALMNTLHSKAMMTKSKTGTLKGEWIVYRIHNDVKYYLCLAAHMEGDDFILKEKINVAIIDFPELLNC